MARTKKKNIGEEFNDLSHNHLPPALNYKFLQALESIHRIDGTTPALRMVWGCTEKWWRLDRMRLKYLTGYALEKTLHRTKGGLFYEEDYAVELGLPRHIVEVWLPPSYFGSNGMDTTFDISVNTDYDNLTRWEANWNLHRYEFIGVESVSASGVERMNAMAKNSDFSRGENQPGFADALSAVGAKLVDVLGPFPRHGEYRYFATIEQEDGNYRQPTMEDVAWLSEAYRLGYLVEQPKPAEVCDIVKANEEKEEALIRSIFDKDEIQREAEKALKPTLYFDQGK